MKVANVVWCTGFVPDFAWIDLPAFAQDGSPLHDRGIVASELGLYFVGLVFQYALASSLVGGVARDAAHIASHQRGRRPRNVRLPERDDPKRPVPPAERPRTEVEANDRKLDLVAHRGSVARLWSRVFT